MRLASRNHPAYNQIVRGGDLGRTQIEVTIRARSLCNCGLLFGSLPRAFILGQGERVSLNSFAICTQDSIYRAPMFLSV
jgi:hypothetical protein